MGTVIDPDVLMEEMAIFEKMGINLKKKLIISPRCHLIMPYHKELDQAYENARGKNKLGTTKEESVLPMLIKSATTELEFTNFELA